MSKEIAQLAWHFLAHNSFGQPILRDGRLLEVGKEYAHSGELVMCAAGYHASIRAIDALTYAPGNVVSLVQAFGDRLDGDDKIVTRRRVALWAYDAEEELRQFARECALNVVGNWNAPDVVMRWLATGDPTLHDDAYYATYSATCFATYYATYSAAYSAACSAANSAATPATRSALNIVLEGILLAGAADRGLI